MSESPTTRMGQYVRGWLFGLAVAPGGVLLVALVDPLSAYYYLRIVLFASPLLLLLAILDRPREKWIGMIVGVLLGIYPSCWVLVGSGVTPT